MSLCRVQDSFGSMRSISEGFLIARSFFKGLLLVLDCVATAAHLSGFKSDDRLARLGASNMREYRWLLLILVLVGFGAEAHASGRRVALVIGNSAYQRVSHYPIRLRMQRRLLTYCRKPNSIP